MAELSFRPATDADSERIFAWRNDPVTVRFSPSGAVTAAQHEAWFAEVLADPDRMLLIVELDAEPVGIVRFDRGGEDAEISINMAPESRGQGLGTAVLRQSARYACTELGFRSIVAKIMPENEASRRAFQKAGYEESGREDGLIVEVYAP